MLTSEQASVVAHFAEQMGDGYLQITNRANLQIRSVHMVAPPSLLSTFQDVGLAAAMISTVDHLRNIMASPTAGIDPQALIDTRALVTALDQTIVQHEEFAGLPAKFSVGFDGGEVVSVRQHPNDIWLVATASPNQSTGEHAARVLSSLVQCRTRAGAGHGPPGTPAQECVPLVVAIAQVYLTHVDRRSLLPPGKKPRLRQVIAQQGISCMWSSYGDSCPFRYLSTCGDGTVSRVMARISAYRRAPSTTARSFLSRCRRSSRSTGNPATASVGRPLTGIWHVARYDSPPGKMR